MKLAPEQIDRVVRLSEGSDRGDVRFDRNGRPVTACARCSYPRVHVDRPYFQRIADRGILCEHCCEDELKRVGIRRIVPNGLGRGRR